MSQYFATMNQRSAGEEYDHSVIWVTVLLLPNNRGEQAFWQDLIEPYRDRVGSILTTRNLRRRRPFISRVDGQPVVGKSPPFGLVLCVWDRFGVGLPVTANVSANEAMPNVFRVTVTHGNGNSITYSLSCHLN